MAVTFKEIETVDNGAHFFNGDLHVDSFGGSHDVTDSAMTPEAVIDQAVKLGIRLLAITDHNNDANTEKSVTYAQKHTGTLIVLPGVEITTAHGHLLVYFAPADSAKVRNLLAKINIVGKPRDKDAHTAMSMADVIKEAELLGGICIAAHIDRAGNGFEMLAAGYPNWKKDILAATGLYGIEFGKAANLI
jgi:predicted metal-dependent phosphoesterase TrpH